MNHSKFLLKYHIILVCKYRKKLLNGNIGNDMKQLFEAISEKSDFRIEIMESDVDHIHLLVSCPPKISPLSVVRRLKQMSTDRIWEMYGYHLKTHFWREKTFWTDGYFVSSVGDVSSENVTEYIRKQGT